MPIRHNVVKVRLSEVQTETIWALLSRAAGRDGAALALLAPGREGLPYEALAAQTLRFALWLRSLGIQRQDRVAVVLPNGPEMAAAFLGTASAAACAPLNPGFTRSDFEYYLKDLTARALLVHPDSPAAAVEAARALGVPVHALQPGPRAGEFVLPETDQGEPEWLEPGDTALLLHTSGTTAKPKLVPLSPANLTASASHIAATLALTPEDRCLNIMPLFHIHGLVAALLASLRAGASVVCTDGVYANAFFGWMAECRPTWYTAVPTMHQGILTRAGEARAAIERTPLRFVRSSSSALPPAVLAELEAAFRVPAVEAYGMTEAAHQMASNPVSPGERVPGSVGLAAGPEVAIMDETGALLEPGRTGEVVIRGPNVTSGYLDNPEANQKAFTNGWFRTGDQGYFDRNGSLFLTGRLKELINRGGEKISPREIDEVLLAHPGVRQSLAFAVPHRQLGEDVGAAVELREEGAATPQDLRDWAAARLPAFKVPRVIRVVEAIPKGPTGKLQRNGLAAKLGIEPLDDTVLGEYTAPRTPLEERIAALWREMLPGARAGVEDRFEALGGDSLLAVRMLAAVSAAEGVDVSPARFVAQGTIAALAASVEEARAAGPGALRVLQPIGSQLPLILLPGHDNALLGAARLAELLAPEQPVFAVDLDRLEAGASLEAMAEECAALLAERFAGREVQLAGVCLGGCLAVEVARRLLQQGTPPAKLFLIDCLKPAWRAQAGFFASLAAGFRQWGHKWRFHSAELARMPLPRLLPYLGGRFADFFKYHGEQAVARSGLRGGPAIERRRLMLAYRPRPVEMGATILRMPGRRLDAHALGWDDVFTRGVDLIGLPFHPNGALAGESPARVAAILRDRRP
ncbi:MAG: AMP-binding protein [Bryobacteraceae bacterium]|nr:AMP-binding protein [Bryobacteraceae bacterium]